MEELGQINPELAGCLTNLSASQADLGTCQGQLTTTTATLTQTQTELAAAQQRIAEMESGEAIAQALARIAELEIPGCMDPDARNYNCHANVPGQCEYPGCTDPAAQNYHPHANVDDGSCRYPCTDNCPQIPGFTFLGNNEQKYAEYVHDQTGIVFVYLPGGTFMMGSPEDEEGRQTNEGPVHQVTLSPFLIGKYELTQAEWQAVMGTNPSAFRGETRPVEQVTWTECEDFCTLTGLRFPTEAQWEFASRAGTTGPFAGTGVLNEMGWWYGNSGNRTHDVGEMKPNSYGLYDMHGNVYEYCCDKYDEFFYSKPEAMGLNPICINTTGTYICRSGAYNYGLSCARSAYRQTAYYVVAYSYFGFRPAFWPIP
jgi:formylglycine-generating enzyme required for sulfatase activity